MMRLVGRLMVAQVLLVGILMVSPPVGAQVRYVDENGVANWVSSRDEVPERYRGKVEKPRLPGMSPTHKDTGAPVEQKLSDACESQFEFAKALAKRQWEVDGKREPLRQHLPSECAEEISRAYPQTRLDE